MKQYMNNNRLKKGLIMKKYFLIPILLLTFIAPVFSQEETAPNETESHEKKAEDLMKKQRDKDYGHKPYVGNISLTVSYGLYNFNSEWENKEKQEVRNYFLSYPYPMIGIDLAFRIGQDQSNPKKFGTHETGPGFHYFRSNDGLFADFEMGARAYGSEANPKFYSYDVYCNGPDKSGCNGKDKMLGNKVQLDPELYYYDVTDSEGNALYTVYYPTTMIPDEAQNDGLTSQQVKKSGRFGSQVFMAYVNTYYHMNFLNYLMTFGYNVNWFDASIGPSLRVAYYNEYSDPVRMERLSDDNTLTTISIVWRQYIQIFRRMRLSARYYWPVFSAISRWTNDVQNNEEEHILNTTIDYSLARYIYFSLGYEYHLWIVNPTAEDRFNRFREGYEMTSRTSNEVFASVTFDIPLTGK